MKKPKLGQNFLVDEAACQRIVAALGDVSQRTVVEIGPGHGAITGLLAPVCGRLELVEFDPGLAKELAFRFRDVQTVTVHHADVLETDLGSLLQGEAVEAVQPAGLSTAAPGASGRDGDLAARADGSLDAVGNLPYYITSDILLHLYAAARAGVVRRAVVMMQREVAERIAAAPGRSEYGPLSAFTQMHAQVTELFTLPPGAFNPPPDVFSTVLRLDFAPRFAELGVEAEGFNKFLRAGFAQKRKTLRNNLRVAGFGAAAVEAAWPEGLDVAVRAEAVPLGVMAGLYRGLVERETVDGSE